MLSPRDLLASLATFSSATRLYAMAFKDERLDVGELLVEAFLPSTSCRRWAPAM
jgi:hypothetical protein